MGRGDTTTKEEKERVGDWKQIAATNVVQEQWQRALPQDVADKAEERKNENSNEREGEERKRGRAR